MNARSVKVRIPADTGFVPLLRTTIAGIAARESFTLEEVDDLRMGVEEAAVLLLRQSEQEPLMLEVSVDSGRLEAMLSTADPTEGELVDESSLPWMILSALADEVRADRQGKQARILLTKTRATLHAHD